MATVPGGLLDTSLVSSDGSSVTLTTLLGNIGVTPVPPADGVDGGVVELPTSTSTTALVNLTSSGRNIVVDQSDSSTKVTGNQTVNDREVTSNVVVVKDGSNAPVSISGDNGESVANVTGGAGTKVSATTTKTNANDAAQVTQSLIDNTANNHGLSNEESAGAVNQYKENANALVTIIGGDNGDVEFNTSAFSLGSDSVVGGDNGRATGDITLEGSAETDSLKNLSLIDIFDMQSGSTVNVSSMSGILLAGSGTLAITDNTNTSVFGDLNDQMIIGGEGNDTLVGGGGNDTLVGGEGNNAFGFNTKGNFVINDFNGSADSFKFGDANLKSIDDLNSVLSGAENVDGNAVFTFFSGEEASTITVVGVSVEDITASMVDFDL